MCDGAVVMGCTELDGSTPNDSDFDAQNGHIHDIAERRRRPLHRPLPHARVSQPLADYPFFPEIAYYDTSVCPSPAPAE